MHDIAQTSQELSNFRREIYTSAENGEKIAAEASQAMFETEAQIKQLSISCESIEDIVAAFVFAWGNYLRHGLILVKSSFAVSI